MRNNNTTKLAAIVAAILAMGATTQAALPAGLTAAMDGYVTDVVGIIGAFGLLALSITGGKAAIRFARQLISAWVK